MPICKHCKKQFPNKIQIDGAEHNLSGRRFCIECSPIGGRNTRKYIVELNNNESFCARCQKIKHKKEFYTRKDSGKPFSYCMTCQKAIKNLKSQEKLERIIEEHGGGCEDCGIVFPAPLFEFYKNGETYHISKAKNMSLQRLKKELNGYLMLCRNCCGLRKWELGNF